MGLNSLKCENNKNITIKDKKIVIKDTFLLDLTCLFWFSNTPLRLLLAKFLGIFGIGGYTVPMLIIIIYIPLIIYIFKTKKIPWRYFHWIFIITVIFFGVTLYFNPEYEYWYSRDIYGIIYTIFRPDHGAIWAFLMIEISNTPERIFKNLKNYSIILFCYNMFLLLQNQSVGYWTAFGESGEIIEKSYSLDFGYDMIFISLIVLTYFFNKKKHKWFYLCLAGFLVLLALTYGSRGALLCLGVYIILYLFNGQQSKIKKTLYSVMFIFIGFFMYNKGAEIIQNTVIYLLNNLNIKSRTLMKIASGDIFDDSGRDAIYNIVKQAIENNPWGYGAYGDRPLIGPSFYWGYSHSIVYEMMINFGVILGVLFLLFLVVKSLCLVFFSKDKYIIFIIMIIFSMTMRLIISDTFWGNIYFWILLSTLFIFRIHLGLRRNN